MNKADEADFREFVTHRSADLMRRAFILTGGDQHAANDLVQVALAKAAGRWRDLDNQMAFLRTVMYRQQVSWWRRGWTQHETTMQVLPDHVGADDLHATELKLAVRAALFRLTARQRAVLFLRHFEDLPEIEVAAILRCSVGNVRSTNHRALARLREVAPELAELYGGRVGPIEPARFREAVS